VVGVVGVVEAADNRRAIGVVLPRRILIKGSQASRPVIGVV